MGKKTVTRFKRICDDLDTIGWKFRVNDLDDSLEFNSVSNGGLWQRMTDYHEAELRTTLREIGYGVSGSGKPGNGPVKDGVMTLGHKNRHNPIHHYFNGLDGRYKPSTKGPYVNELFAKFFVNPDGMFGRWLFRWMVGAIAKSFTGQRNPMLVLVGGQDMGKSTLCEWLCPIDRYFLRGKVNPDDKDSFIRLIDTFLWELDELGATTRKADAESLKSFLTMDFIRVRPAYGRYAIEKSVVCSFLGTVNHDGAGFLVDPTGTTRFLSCEVNGIDFDYTTVDVDDLWAEAYWYYRNVPDSFRLTKEETALQAKINGSYEMPSALEEVIIDLFEFTNNRGDFMATAEIKNLLALHYRITSEQLFHRDLSVALTRLGCEKGRETFVAGGDGHRRGWRGLRARSTNAHQGQDDD